MYHLPPCVLVLASLHGNSGSHFLQLLGSRRERWAVGLVVNSPNLPTRFGFLGRRLRRWENSNGNLGDELLVKTLFLENRYSSKLSHMLKTLFLIKSSITKCIISPHISPFEITQTIHIYERKRPLIWQACLYNRENCYKAFWPKKSSQVIPCISKQVKLPRTVQLWHLIFLIIQSSITKKVHIMLMILTPQKKFGNLGKFGKWGKFCELSSISYQSIRLQWMRCCWKGKHMGFPTMWHSNLPC